MAKKNSTFLPTAILLLTTFAGVKSNRDRRLPDRMMAKRFITPQPATLPTLFPPIAIQPAPQLAQTPEMVTPQSLATLAPFPTLLPNPMPATPPQLIPGVVPITIPNLLTLPTLATLAPFPTLFPNPFPATPSQLIPGINAG